MLKAILSDLREVNGIDVDYLINPKLDLNINEFNQIQLDHNLTGWLKDNAYMYDYAIFIAPEDNYIQYEISKILEDNHVKIVGSTSQASYICTSKHRTYEHVDNVLKIPSLKISLTRNFSYDEISQFIRKYETCIIKPDNMTSSDFIYKISTTDEFSEIIKIYEKHEVYDVIIQQYINGKSISVSIINSPSYFNCLCINTQEIIDENHKISYHGCKTPIQHPLECEIIKVSEKITKQLKGLNGFFGIDYIICDDKIYLVEINSRITTPYIVLSDIADKNLIECVIDSVVNDNLNLVNFSKHGEFIKKI